MALIDIVLTAYNAEKYIDDQINSVIKQTFTNWRLIIVDDASDDTTLEHAKLYAKKYPHKIEVYQNLKNQGLIKNFTVGLQKTTAELIAVCDVDDYWQANKLQLQYDFLVKNPAVEMCHHDLSIADENLNIIEYSYAQKLKMPSADHNGLQNNFKYLLDKNFVTAPSILFRASLKRYLLPFPRVFFQDQWIALIASSRGAIGYLDEPLVLYRQREGNMQGANTKGLKYYKSIYGNKEFKNEYTSKNKEIVEALRGLIDICNDGSKLMLVQQKRSQLNSIITLLQAPTALNSVLFLIKAYRAANGLYQMLMVTFFFTYRLSLRKYDIKVK